MENETISVPYGQTVHGQEEIDACVNVLKTSTQMGKNVRDFERSVADLFAKRFGIMVNSGSSALMLALEIANIPKGSEVITPALTFSTTVSYIVRNGLIPSFVDVEPATYCIDPNKIEQMITPKTKAIVAPHLIGNILNWKEIVPIAQKYNLLIIEDSADTLGAVYDGVSSGYFSHISTTSFYGSHIINCAGNGGMLCVNDEELHRKAKLLRSWGRSSSLFVDSESVENRFNVEVDGIPYDAKFVFEDIGHNLEPSELGAAFGLVQLKKLNENIEARQRHFTRQLKFFTKFEEFFVLPEQTKNTTTGWLAFPIIIRDSAPFSRRDFQIYLEEQSIQTRVVFTGNITRQPGFKNIEMKKARDGYVNADAVMRGGVLLACHHGLTEKMINHTQSVISKFIGKACG